MKKYDYNPETANYVAIHTGYLHLLSPDNRWAIEFERCDETGIFETSLYLDGVLKAFVDLASYEVGAQIEHLINADYTYTPSEHTILRQLWFNPGTCAVFNTSLRKDEYYRLGVTSEHVTHRRTFRNIHGRILKRTETAILVKTAKRRILKQIETGTPWKII